MVTRGGGFKRWRTLTAPTTPQTNPNPQSPYRLPPSSCLRGSAAPTAPHRLPRRQETPIEARSLPTILSLAPNRLRCPRRRHDARTRSKRFRVRVRDLPPSRRVALKAPTPLPSHAPSQTPGTARCPATPFPPTNSIRSHSHRSRPPVVGSAAPRRSSAWPRERWAEEPAVVSRRGGIAILHCAARARATTTTGYQVPRWYGAGSVVGSAVGLGGDLLVGLRPDRASSRNPR